MAATPSLPAVSAGGPCCRGWRNHLGSLSNWRAYTPWCPPAPNLPRTPPLLTALALATPAAAQVVDQGVVIVDPDDHLRIGVDAFGQRDVIGVADGPYSAITVGEGIDGQGALSVNGGDLSGEGDHAAHLIGCELRPRAVADHRH